MGGWRLGCGGGRATANEAEAVGLCLRPGVPACPRRVRLLQAAAFFAAPATERARFAAATGASHDATGYHQLGHKEVLNARRGASFALPHALAAAVPPAQSALDAAGRQDIHLDRPDSDDSRGCG